MRSSVVCEESNARPMSGRATFATARFRFATAATRINAASTSPARAGVAGRGPMPVLVSVIEFAPPDDVPGPH